MKEHEFKERLGEIIDQLKDVPAAERPRLEALAKETAERHDKMRRTMKDLQESLDYLRLTIKYLVFDLEATRRENAYLRKIIEGTAGPQAPQSDAPDAE